MTARLRNGRLARFEAGSIDPNPDRAPLLCRNHDREHPIGVIVDAADNGDGIYARARVSAFGAGDEALTLAADGVLRGLSVGVEALDWTEEGDPADPTIVVTAGRWDELSLVPWAAYEGAAVDYVAASAPDPPDEPEPDEPAPDDEPDQPEGDEEVTDVLDAAAPVPALRRAAALTPTRPNLSLYAVAREMCDAVRASGPAPSLGLLDPIISRHNGMALQAALTDVVTPSGTSGVSGLVRESWAGEVVGLITFGAPVVAAFMQGNLDSNPVAYPKWTTLPVIEKQATQKTQIGTGPVRIDKATATVDTYAGGNDVAMQVIDWSSPDFIAEYFRAATEVYARTIDAVMFDMVVAAATAQTESTDLAADLGAAIGAVASTGLPPDRIIVSGDKFGELWAANVGAVSGAIGQVLNIDLPVPRVVLAPLADAGTLIVTSSRVAKSWQNRGAPVQLRAVDVALLGVDLGVYGYFASAIVIGPTTANPSIVAIGPAGP